MSTPFLVFYDHDGTSFPDVPERSFLLLINLEEFNLFPPSFFIKIVLSILTMKITTVSGVRLINLKDGVMSLIIDRQNRQDEDKECIVGESYEIVLPFFVQKKMKIKPGDVLIWEYDEKNKIIMAQKKTKYHEVITIEADDFTINFKVIKNKWQIYEILKTTVPIQEDHSFMLHYYMNKQYKHLKIPELAGVLIELFGEPDNFYDDYKSSFNYTFDLKVYFKNINKEVHLPMTIFDYKDSLYFKFRRPKENERDNVLKYVEDLIKREDLNKIIIILNNYFYGFYEGFGGDLYKEFERIQPYPSIKYGYKDGRFFKEELAI